MAMQTREGERLMLEPLGLEPHVEAIYRLVLENPAMGPEELAAGLRVQLSEVHDALDRLADLHLLLPAGDGSNRLRPVSPDVGLTALLARSEVELNARQRQIEATRSAVAALASQYRADAEYAPEVVHQLVGLDAVRKRLSDLAESARVECLSFFPGGAQMPDTMEASKPLDQQALERGVDLRTLYQDSFRNDPETLKYVRWLGGLGGRTRTVPSLPMLMVIVDSEVALVPLDPDDGRRGALELRSPGAVTAMRTLFEQFWSVATPWDEVSPPNENGLSARDQELLRLLATGHTDEAIARKFGVSLRTVRRAASDLMSRLGARSRFEAGVLATRSGWL
jgi:DNA-binding CsgD family transcriptional regulator/sugar-specific transcriptional regulator TrmB